jgi:hypothetical protein
LGTASDEHEYPYDDRPNRPCAPAVRTVARFSRARPVRRKLPPLREDVVEVVVVRPVDAVEDVGDSGHASVHGAPLLRAMRARKCQ